MGVILYWDDKIRIEREPSGDIVKFEISHFKLWLIEFYYWVPVENWKFGIDFTEKEIIKTIINSSKDD